MKQFKQVGNNVTINELSIFGHPKNIVLGNDVYIGPEAYIWARGGLIIENNVIIGPRVTIHTTNHRYENAEMIPYDGCTIIETVVIEKNVWIGGNVLICPGVRIGEGAVVGMGSVVTRDVPPCTLVGGNPAKVIKHRDRGHYQELEQNGKQYMRLKAKGLVNYTTSGDSLV